MEDPESISWDIEVGNEKTVSVQRDGDLVVVFQNYGDAPPIYLTRGEAMAMSEALRRTAQLIAPEGN